MTLTALIGLLAVQILVAMSPGPATMVSINVSARDGLQAGLRIAGGLFLVWLGVKAWRGATAPMPQEIEVETRSIPSVVRLGVLTDLANPKALAYFAAVFTGILPSEPSLWDAVAILCIVFVVEFAWYALVAMTFSRARVRTIYARLKAGIERCFGAVLALFGARIAAG